MTITYSIETLYHFRCSECKRWWSVGDWKRRKQMICPHCGHVDMKVKEESK